MRAALWAIGVTVAGLVLAGGMMSKAETRPSRVSIAVEPHGSVLAVMRAVVNGLPLFDSSLRGRTESRSPDGRVANAVEIPWRHAPGM